MIGWSQRLAEKRHHGAVATVIALLLVGAACSSDSTTPTTSDTTSTTSIPNTSPDSTTTIQPPAPDPEPAEASAPPPVDFSEVQTDYESSLGGIGEAGRLALEQFTADDLEALWGRFEASYATEVSVEDLRDGRAQLTSQAPIGEQIAERAFPIAQSIRLFRGQLEWGEDSLEGTVVFNEDWEIITVGLEPKRPRPPDPSAGYESGVSYRVPFEGLWFVLWGGDVELENYHVVAQDQRHALDLVVWKEGGTFGGFGIANTDYWAYGQKVLAPADGTVVTVVDGLPDNLPQVETDSLNPAGNHVVIEVAEGEYVLIAHMQAGSLEVAEGDVVVQGQMMGLVGNSGNTSEPHIHIHVQDRATFDSRATGLPLEFSSYLANGEPVESGELLADQFVANR